MGKVALPETAGCHFRTGLLLASFLDRSKDRHHESQDSKISRNKDQVRQHFQYKYHFLSEALRPSEESARGERSAWSVFSRLKTANPQVLVFLRPPP